MTNDQRSELRKLASEATCDKCDGEGTRAYGDSSCGRGAGGQTITVGACRDCRGLGWKLSYLEAARTAIPDLLDQLDRAEAALSEACDLAEALREVVDQADAYDASPLKPYEDLNIKTHIKAIRAKGQPK